MCPTLDASHPGTLIGFLSKKSYNPLFEFFWTKIQNLLGFMDVHNFFCSATKNEARKIWAKNMWVCVTFFCVTFFEALQKRGNKYLSSTYTGVYHFLLKCHKKWGNKNLGSTYTVYITFYWSTTKKRGNKNLGCTYVGVYHFFEVPQKERQQNFGLK